MSVINPRDVRAFRAKQHTAEMAARYGREIDNAVSDTKIYRYIRGKAGEFQIPAIRYPETAVSVVAADAVSAVLQHAGTGKTAVLSFASYRNPGGGFLVGSMAQEEALCHESFLYNVLTEFRDYYDVNARDTNRGLYRDTALYTPGVVFRRNAETAVCDVITCASPNWRAARNRGVTHEENARALTARIRFILNVAAEQKVDALILGAFGCGVFAQDPREVAEIFADALKRDFAGRFARAVFAVPDAGSENYTAFRDVVRKLFPW